MDEVVKPKGLELLRSPFQENQISKLPKGTKAQNACKPEEKINCKICGGWHHPKIIHLDYVGHAALTDRLLDADPLWSWEPLALKDGLPAFDSTGGLWIKLTVCGHTRIGYGHAEASSFKEIGSREKEVIGDALRNAAMRFGAALDLWHKGDLHVEEHEQEQKKSAPPKKATPEPPRSHPACKYRRYYVGTDNQDADSYERARTYSQRGHPRNVVKVLRALGELKQRTYQRGSLAVD